MIMICVYFQVHRPKIVFPCFKKQLEFKLYLQQFNVNLEEIWRVEVLLKSLYLKVMKAAMKDWNLLQVPADGHLTIIALCKVRSGVWRDQFN